MKIKKIANSVGLVGNVTNEYSESIQDSYACAYVNGFHGKVLWTNSEPTSEMSIGTKISLSSADYDMLEVIFVDNVSSAEKGILSVRMIKGYNWRLSNIVNNVMTYRLITRNSDTEFTVGNGFAGTEVQERRCVPLYVIGYKTGLFE